MKSHNMLTPSGVVNGTPNGTSNTITGVTLSRLLFPSGSTTVVDEIIRERWKYTPLATELRKELEGRLDLVKVGLITCWAPKIIAVLVEYSDSTFQCRLPKHQNLPDSAIFVEKYDQMYCQFFPSGSITFTFPPEHSDITPLAQYHAIQGATYMHFDWTMSHPEIQLFCIVPGWNEMLIRGLLCLPKEPNTLSNHPAKS
jgi:hypothetical protein